MNAPPAPASPPLLSVRALTIAVPGPTGESEAVVDGVSFEILAGEVVALVGESGCGKSLTGLALLDLVPPPVRIASGEVIFEGRDVRALAPREKERLRGGGIGLVFQEPGSALDPVRTIGSELSGVLRRHRGLSRAEARAEAVTWLHRVALPDPERQMDALPHLMSGGMRQRAMLALALAGGPRLLVADEPTTALDVTIQAQILDLMKDLTARLGTAVILITHSLGVVAGTCDTLCVMYAGRVVERGATTEIFAEPKHPYTQGLIKSVPRLDKESGDRLFSIRGQPPNVIDLPDCCPFYPRCDRAMDVCKRKYPRTTEFANGRSVSCWLYTEAR